jgi:hypothetical protein
MTPSRSDSFVPLTAALPASSGERTEFRATVLSEPGEVQKFQTVTVPAEGTPPAPRAENCQPQVTVQRDGNRVTGIRVQCSCGEVIELACAYEEAAPATPAPQAVSAQPATNPPLPTAKPETGKICKDSGKDLPTSASKKPKVPEKGRGTSAAKRRSA